MATLEIDEEMMNTYRIEQNSGLFLGRHVSVW
jgi:hypothetical protein